MSSARLTGITLFSLTSTLLLAAPASAQWLEPDVDVLLEIDSVIPSHFFGWTAVMLGDVDDDGVSDLAVSSSFDGGGAPSGGSVRAYSGASGDQIWVRFENLQSSILGYAMEVYDWNGDGVQDVIAGGPFNGPSGGRVWVYSGDDGSILDTIDPGSNAGQNFGVAITIGGDFNGDGSPDMAVGALNGEVWIYEVGSGDLITTIVGPAGGFDFGIGLAFLGNIDGDTGVGGDELVIGQRLADFWSGEALVYGWSGLVPIFHYKVEGVGMGFNLIGDRIDGGRDLDGDGIGDFFVGDMNAGAVQVFSGVDGEPIYTLAPAGEDGDFAPAHFIDDIDSDGVADIVAGSWSSDTGANNAGKAFLYSGAKGDLLREMTYTIASGGVGTDLRSAGDFNGDGVTDFLVGASGGGFNGPPPGRVFIIAGLNAADINGDGNVDVLDLQQLILSWGACNDCENCPADINGDCAVDVLDLIALLIAWG